MASWTTGFANGSAFVFSSSIVRRLNKCGNLINHFLVGLCAGRFETSMPTFRQIDAQTPCRFHSSRFCGFPQSRLCGFPLSTIVGSPFRVCSLRSGVNGTHVLGSLFSTMGGMRARVSCPAPLRSKADMTSAVSCGGFGACEKELPQEWGCRASRWGVRVCSFDQGWTRGVDFEVE